MLTISAAFSQAPHGLSYQAVVRDNGNLVIPGETIDVRFGITTVSAGGALIWQEEHNTTTNDFGLFSLVIGDGSKSGGSLAAFSDIDWSSASHFLHVSVYYQSAWHDFPANQVISVPYALTAKSAEDDGDKDDSNELIESITLTGTTLSVTEAGQINDVDLSDLMDSPFTMNGDTVTLVDPYFSLSIGSPNPGKSKVAIISPDNSFEEALFEVKRADGQTIFAVYNEAVKIYLPTDSTTKGPKGGFSIGGFDRNKGITEDYMWVTPDSIRMYIDETPFGAKGPKGGFSIGGFDRTKNTYEDYMVLTADSTRFYIDDTGSKGTKGTKGGFSIGGFDRNKAGSRQDYMKVTMDSTRIFVNDSIAGFSVANVQTGTPKKFMDLNKINSFVGHESGQKTQPSGAYEGKYNAFFGYKAGLENTSGYGNIFVGHETGRDTKDGSYNVYMGYSSGKSNTSGNSNVFVGYESGVRSSKGYNVYIGQGTGKWNDLGTENIYIGAQCGVDDGRYSESPGYEAGYSNTFIGYRSGASHWTGGQNVYIGTRAGEQTQATSKGGFGRIFIGYKAGQKEGADNVLYIENSDSDTPLIFGNFETGSEEVIINGDFSYTGKKGALSDGRYKEDLQPMGNVLDKISEINGTYFSWKEEEYPDMVFGDGRQIGLIAQDIEKIYPELVNETSRGYKTVDYEKLSVILLEGIKEQQTEIEKIQGELKTLKEQLNRILEME